MKTQNSFFTHEMPFTPELFKSQGVRGMYWYSEYLAGAQVWTNKGFAVVLIIALVGMLSLSSFIENNAEQKIATARLILVTENPHLSQNLTRDINCAAKFFGNEQVSKKIYVNWASHFVGFKTAALNNQHDRGWRNWVVDTAASNKNISSLSLQLQKSNVWPQVQKTTAYACSDTKPTWHYPGGEQVIVNLVCDLQDLGPIPNGNNGYIDAYWAYFKKV
jgi:hypothetical protein